MFIDLIAEDYLLLVRCESLLFLLLLSSFVSGLLNKHFLENALEPLALPLFLLLSDVFGSIVLFDLFLSHEFLLLKQLLQVVLLFSLLSLLFLLLSPDVLEIF